MLDRKSIKKRAKEALSDNYGVCIGTLVVSILIAVVAAFVPYAGTIIAIAVTPVVMVGLMNVYLHMYRGENVEFGDMFDGFRNYGHVLGGYWYMYLFIFLWSLLLYIPGIIKAYAYSMAPYILMDQPEISATDALEKSKQMTYGHKWEIFVMHLSFIGWGILSSLTMGILGIFFVGPYFMLTMAGYYVVLRNQEMGYMNGQGGTYNAYADPNQQMYQQVNPQDNFQSGYQDNPYMGYNPANETNNNNPYTQGMDDTF